MMNWTVWTGWPILQVEFLTERQPSTEPSPLSLTSSAGSQLIAMEETEERQWPLHPAAAKACRISAEIVKDFFSGPSKARRHKMNDFWCVNSPYLQPSDLWVLDRLPSAGASSCSSGSVGAWLWPGAGVGAWLRFHSLLMVKDGCWSRKNGVSIIPSADVLATSVEVATRC